MKFIPFNKPHLSGNETAYIQEAVLSGKISGDGMFTKNAMPFFRSVMAFRNVCSPLPVPMHWKWLPSSSIFNRVMK
ncbi:MAG: hypothetical protein ACK4E8_06515 [Lacibacter sp.]